MTQRLQHLARDRRHMHDEENASDMLGPHLRESMLAFAMALVLTPFLQPGVPVLLTASVAVVAGVLEVRRRTDPAVPS